MHGPQHDYIIGPASAFSAPERGSLDRNAGRDRDRVPNRYDGDRDRDNDGVRDHYDRDRDNDGVRNRHDSRPDDPHRY